MESDKEAELGFGKPSKSFNIFKNVWARVYLNVYGGKFTKDNGLTLKAALMEFFLPTTKRKQSWRHWLGNSSGDFGVLGSIKAAFIILLDIALFFPRLAINVAKLVTEVLPDTLAQLFLLAKQKANKRYEKKQGLVAAGYWLASAVTLLFAGLFKFIYFIGCCITSPIATSIRARNFNYKSKTVSRYQLPFVFSHLTTPAISFGCYFAIAVLLANFIPGLGFVLLIPSITVVSMLILYTVVDHLLSNFNRNPNGDTLFELNIFNGGHDQLRYSDRDVSEKIVDGASLEDTRNLRNGAYREVEQEIERTLKYEAGDTHDPYSSFFVSPTPTTPTPIPTTVSKDLQVY